MKLDGKRHDATCCPSGHRTVSMTAGLCSGCGRINCKGDEVRNCQHCKFCSCQVCCQREETDHACFALDWNSISAQTLSALDNIERIAKSFTAFCGLNIEQPGLFVPSGWKSGRDAASGWSATTVERPASAEVCQDREASVMVSSYCMQFSAMNALPTDRDLDDFWKRCYDFPAASVANAIYEQLSFATGNQDWQPRLRALFALEHLHWKVGKGNAIASLVLDDSEEIIRYLASVPACREKARRLLWIMADAVGDRR